MIIPADPENVDAVRGVEMTPAGTVYGPWVVVGPDGVDAAVRDAAVSVPKIRRHGSNGIRF